MTNDSLKEIQAELHRSDEAKYIHRLHGVFLVLKGLSTVKVGELLDEPQRTIADWAKRYREGGLNALQVATRSGRPTVLTHKQESILKKAMSVSPRRYSLHGDRWTGELVSAFLKSHFKLEMTIRNSRRILRKLRPETGAKH